LQGNRDAGTLVGQIFDPFFTTKNLQDCRRVRVGVLEWQGITAKGSSDPMEAHGSKVLAMIDIGVLVFREGLESILVLSAITASMISNNGVQRRPFAMCGCWISCDDCYLVYRRWNRKKSLSKHSGP
jgi:hypothetical protein